MINNFLDISDLSRSQLINIINNKVQNNNLIKKNIGCLFEKPSTRTRISFAVCIHNLQGNSIDLNLNELNFSRKESLEDTFRAFGCYLDGLIYRTSKHDNLMIARDIMNKPIINALSDKSHPCQTLADLITLFEIFHTLKLEISWFGDINNVLFSLIEAANLLDEIKLNIFSHKTLLKNIKCKMNSNIFLYDKIENSLIKSSDCIMTDVFESMNDTENTKKSELLKSFQINSDVMNITKNKCVFMHCLPAKIGQEVTLEVINSSKSVVWNQAKNRLHAQMRLMKCINW